MSEKRKPSPMETWWRVPDAALELGYDVASVHRLLKKGKLRYERTRLGIIVVDPASVAEYKSSAALRHPGRPRRPICA